MFKELDHDIRNGLIVLIRIGNCLLETATTYGQADLACQLITEAKRAYMAYSVFKNRVQNEKS